MTCEALPKIHQERDPLGFFLFKKDALQGIFGSIPGAFWEAGSCILGKLQLQLHFWKIAAAFLEDPLETQKVANSQLKCSCNAGASHLGLDFKGVFAKKHVFYAKMQANQFLEGPLETQKNANFQLKTQLQCSCIPLGARF